MCDPVSANLCSAPIVDRLIALMELDYSEQPPTTIPADHSVSLLLIIIVPISINDNK